MQFGNLTFRPLSDEPLLVAEPLRPLLHQGELPDGFYAAAIDAGLADTAAFCDTYGVSLQASANCIIVEPKRADKTWYAACVVLASHKLDVNNKLRRDLEARKISFAPRETALAITGMEFGGVTPLGLPADLPILIDEKVTEQENVIIGSGIRGSKILARSTSLVALQGATVIDITK